MLKTRNQFCVLKTRLGIFQITSRVDGSLEKCYKMLYSTLNYFILNSILGTVVYKTVAGRVSCIKHSNTKTSISVHFPPPLFQCHTKPLASTKDYFSVSVAFGPKFTYVLNLFLKNSFIS